MKKRILVFILSAVILVLCNGCKYKGYFGEHVDLYTAATNSILWNNGHSFGSDKEMDPKIKVIEQDRYGRTLFTYYEKYYFGCNSGEILTFSALLITQHSSEEYVYYYEDYNYLILRQEDIYIPSNKFTEDDIEYLKELNDWDKALDLDLCVKKAVINKKPEISEDSPIKQKIKEKFGTQLPARLILDHLTDDENGNTIVYGFNEKIIDGKVSSDYFAAIVQLDGENIRGIEFFEPSDLYDYRDEFIEFKKQNGWVSQ